MTLTTSTLPNFPSTAAVSPFQVRVFAMLPGRRSARRSRSADDGARRTDVDAEWNVPPGAFATVFSAAPAGMIAGA